MMASIPAPAPCPFPSHNCEIREFASAGWQFQAIHGYRFADEATRRELDASIARRIGAALSPADRRQAGEGLANSQHILLAWRGAPDGPGDVALATAGWGHAPSLRFLRLRLLAAAGAALPDTWLEACLSQAARFDRGAAPAIVGIVAPARLHRGLAAQIAALGGARIGADTAATELAPDRIAAAVGQALARIGRPGRLPLCLLAQPAPPAGSPA